MSTRSNIILVTPDNKVHQFYHHCDGYLSGVGEELRRSVLYSIGFTTVVKDISTYDAMVNCLSLDEDYESEHIRDLNDHNGIHADIEYTYVIKGSDLYYVYKWGLCDLVNTNKDLIDYICKDCNKINLGRRLTREDDK